jgi:hypothetical protein
MNSEHDDVRRFADFVREVSESDPDITKSVDMDALAKAKADAIAGEHGVVGSIAPEIPAVASDVRPQLPWHQRAQNWLRLKIAHWLGLTFVLQELNRKCDGNRQDLEHVAKTLTELVTKLNQAITQLNANTQLIGYVRANDLRIGKLANEWEAIEAKRQSKVVSNGESSKIILDSKGNTANPSDN